MSGVVYVKQYTWEYIVESPTKYITKAIVMNNHLLKTSPTEGKCKILASINLATFSNQKVRKLKGMEHVSYIFISFDKYLFLEVINILI